MWVQARLHCPIVLDALPGRLILLNIAMKGQYLPVRPVSHLSVKAATGSLTPLAASSGLVLTIPTVPCMYPCTAASMKFPNALPKGTATCLPTAKHQLSGPLTKFLILHSCDTAT